MWRNSNTHKMDRVSGRYIKKEESRYIRSYAPWKKSREEMADNFDDLLNIQRNIERKAKEEVETDRTIELMNLINSLVPDDKMVQLEHIYIAASQKGFTEKQVNEVLRKYIHEKIMYQPRVGYIQRE